MILCLNGNFVDEREAVISVFDRGFLYGDGVFTTLAVVSGEPIWLDEHLERFTTNCQSILLELPWSREELSNYLQQTLEHNNFCDGRVRLSASRGVGQGQFVPEDIEEPTLLIYCREGKPAADVVVNGIRATTGDFVRSLPTIKSANYLASTVAKLEAQRSGFDDVIFVDANEHVLESTTGNVFIVQGGSLRTTAADVLPGITVAKLVARGSDEGLSIERENFTKEELLHADEVFLTNAVELVVPVLEIDGQRIGTGQVGPYALKAYELLRNAQG